MKILVVLALLVLLVSTREVPCTYTDPSGSFYDLSPLSDCGLNGYTVDAGAEGPFTINICNSVNTDCGGVSSVCQFNQYIGGKPNATSFSPRNGGKGVTLTYGDGDTTNCPNKRARSSVLNFICDPSASSPQFNFTGENPTCTYNFDVVTQYACPTTKGPQKQTCPIYVYLVPHTHDDVGWIVTIDFLYAFIVRNIISTVVSSLVQNPQRKFIYVEQAFFWRWWTDPSITDAQRNDFRTIYKNGQWEFVIGGWVMEDEACTTFGADIEQLTLGHQFLLNTFGAIPTRGWQIDPFGQSSVTPTLEKLAGFKSHLIDRVSYKPQYQQEKKLHFNWYGSPSLGDEAMIFTEIMDGASNAYCDWYFTFDFDKQSVNSGNVASWAEKFYQMVESRSGDLLTNVMLAAWGCDFQFQNATPMFASMDILVDYLQQQQDQTFIYVKYATLSEYYEALQSVPNVEWPTNHGNDFFPLFETLYWTGFYTSRVALKGIVRQGEAASHVVEPLFSIAKALKIPQLNFTQAYQNIYQLRLANADAQHHDGITGTSEPGVVQMYEDDILNGMQGTFQSSATILSNYISKGQNAAAITPVNNLLNIKNGQFIPVVIYNSLGWTRKDFIVLPVNKSSLVVYDSNNNLVPSQVNANPTQGAPALYNLFFQVTIPAFGFQTYFVSASGSEDTITKSYKLELGADTTYTNGALNVTISGSTGRISSITNIASKVEVSVDQNLLSYTSKNSGAYAFGPAGFAKPINNAAPTTTVTTGPLVTEIYQVFTQYAKQNIRLYRSSSPDASSFVELNYTLGRLPEHYEIISRFSSSIENQQLFSTDDNGFEFLVRETSYQIPIEGNYYPSIYAAYIQDKMAQLTVISDRSHGVSSLDDGQLEVMVHRNPNMTEYFGPGLTDLDIVYPVTRVIVDTPQATTLQVRRQPYLLNFPLTFFTGAPTSSVDSWTKQYATSTSFISGDLPLNIHMLSLNPLNVNTTQTILRFTHMFAVGEDPILSATATIDVAALFPSLSISSFVEVTLTANQVIQNNAPTKVVLSCKQIRSFVVEFK